MFFIDQDEGNKASATNNIVMGKVMYSSNVRNVVKCGTGKYVVVLRDIDIDIKKDIDKTAFSCREIFASDALHSVGTTYLGLAAKSRYGNNKYTVHVHTAQAIRSASTGLFEIDDYHYVCRTLDGNNLPINTEQFTAWWNGCLPEEFRENGISYWAIGLVVVDENSDQYQSAFGGCQVLIDASQIV